MAKKMRKSKPTTKNANKKQNQKKETKPPIGNSGFKRGGNKANKSGKTRSKTKNEKPSKLVTPSPTEQSRKISNTSKAAKKGTTAATRITKTIRTKENKQTNTITFLSGGIPENVAKKFENNYNEKLVKKYLTKNKPVKGKPAKEPRGAVIIVTAKFEGQKKTFSKATDLDFVVTENSLIDFVSDYLDNAADEFADLYGFENSTIDSYAIKFIY